MKKALAYTILLLTLSVAKASSPYVGVFKPNDSRIDTIMYGNWGSRPYEYAWASSLFPLHDKRVIDLGIGIPSQYNWYTHVVENLKPAFYAGIDWDARILKELITQSTYEVRHMNMANLEYSDASFDIAFCISTFEHLPYNIFIKAIQEAHRVLKHDGLLIITLDEEWDMREPVNEHNGWNELELSLLNTGRFVRGQRSFGLPEFLTLIKNYFVLYVNNAYCDTTTGSICSKDGKTTYYARHNKDTAILNSGLPTNSCVSYAVLKKA